MIRKTTKTSPTGEDAVERLQQQVRTAKAMQSIPGRELLEDAATNPTAYTTAEALRDARHRTELEMRHKRALRALRVADAREAADERAEAEVTAARESQSPARSVLALSRSRERFGRAALAASLLLSVGSAMGIEAWVSATWSTAPTGVGYLAEVGLTGMATAAILWRGHLAHHSARLTDGQQRALTGLIAVPLLVSMVASTAGSGPIGAACSAGAAAFAWLAYLVSTTAAAAIQRAVERLDDEADHGADGDGGGRQEHGDVLPADEAAAPGDDWTPERVEDAVIRAQADEGVREIEEHLSAHTDRHGRSHGPSERPERSHEAADEHGGDAPEEEPPRQGAPERSHRPDGPPERSDGASKRPTAAEINRRRAEENRRAVTEYLQENPDAKSPEIAARTNLGESTVRRILNQLKREGGGPR